MFRNAFTFVLCSTFVVLSSGVGYAQRPHHYHWSANVVMPQARSSAANASPIQVSSVEVGVVIVEQVATTTMDVHLNNNSGSQTTAELLIPVPQGVAIRKFTFQGSASEPTAELLDSSKAKDAFESIVRKLKDPALLEFAGLNLVRTCVFPVAANGEQTVRLTYEHLLEADGDRIDYVLPRSEAIDYQAPWKVSVRIKSQRQISAVYSPSHQLETTRAGNIVSARIAEAARREPGAFRLSYLLEKGDVTASLFAYPDSTGDGGYFLLLAGLAHQPKGKGRISRELTLVLDRSGSMNGEKMEQAREAALQVLSGLEEGEYFNILTYSDGVDHFADRPIKKTDDTISAARAYLKRVTARGGTNIHDALLEAMRPKPAVGTLPIVLFLTDGLPTVGQTSELAIRSAAEHANKHERRLFTFGVGVDVNTPLLDKLAISTRAFSTFALPGEDVEVKVGKVFKGLDGPVLAAPELRVVKANGEPALGRVTDLIPGKLADLFLGDQLIVLGRYAGAEPLHFVLAGNHLGKQRRFEFNFPLKNQGVRNAFVARLWASRKIARLTDEIRDMGAQTDAASIAKNEPRLKELTTEIVRLSTEFGILTEYTSFLAREGVDLTEHDDVLAEAQRNFESRAIRTRSGYASLNQEFNNDLQRNQTALNPRNCYWSADMRRVEITTVQQVNDQAFYRRGNSWVDSRLVEQSKKVKPTKTIEFGSDEFMQLAWKLVRQGRQTGLALQGDIILQLDGETVLLKAPQQSAEPR